jgi:hypothetical protein
MEVCIRKNAYTKSQEPQLKADKVLPIKKCGCEEVWKQLKQAFRR